MPDVSWYAGSTSTTITIGTTATASGTANRLLRDDGTVVRSSIAADDGSNITLTTGGLLVTANDQGALGASGTAFADLFLASGGVINFNAGNLTLTHSAGKITNSGSLTLAAGTAAAPALELAAASATGLYGSSGSMAFTIAGTYHSGFLTTQLVLKSSAMFGIAADGSALSGADVAYGRSAIGVGEINSGTAGTLRDLTLRNVVAASGYLEIMEQSAPSAGQRASCRLFTVDNGAGKRALKGQFGTGAAVTIITEP